MSFIVWKLAMPQDEVPKWPCAVSDLVLQGEKEEPKEAVGRLEKGAGEASSCHSDEDTTSYIKISRDDERSRPEMIFVFFLSFVKFY